MWPKIAAEIVGIGYENGKAILKVFRREGRREESTTIREESTKRKNGWMTVHLMKLFVAHQQLLKNSNVVVC